MPEVKVVAVSDLDADSAFQRLQQFDRLAEHSDAVRKVRVARDGDIQVSCWEANFRNGILVWSEYDAIDQENRRIKFSRRDGDPVAFDGEWLIEPMEVGSRIEFSASFDLGMLSFADIVDPIAQATLHDNIVDVLSGVLDAHELPATHAAH